MTNTPKGSLWRRVLAGALIIGTLIVGTLGFIETCDETAVVTGSNVEIVEVCRAAPLLDARYLLVLIIAVLLMWPDLSEVAVGPFSIRRRLEQTESEQRELKGQVQQLSQTIQMSQTNKTVIVVEPSYVDLAALLEKFAEAKPLAGDTPSRGGRSNAEVTVDILRKYERVRLFDTRVGNVPDSLDFITASGPSDQARLWAVQVADAWPEAAGIGAAMSAEQARVFTSNFPELLDGVRAVRNAVAHDKHIAEDDLDATLSIVVGLESFLLDRFEHWRSEDSQGLDIGPRIGAESFDTTEGSSAAT